MNPSALGWIPKFITLVNKQQLTEGFDNENTYYKELQNTGFLYGLSIKTLIKIPFSNKITTTAEYTKINLFNSLLFTFFIKNPNANYKNAIKSILLFYNSLEKGKTSFFSKLSFSQSNTSKLEHILEARMQESNSVFKKNISSVLTYTLLYLDVLTYRKFLDNTKNIKEYEQELELTIIHFCFFALKSKRKKNKFDQQFIEEIESSSDYLSNYFIKNKFLSENIFQKNTSLEKLEKKFIFELCCLAVWDDKELDASELEFLETICYSLSLPKETIKNNISFIQNFSKEHSKNIQLFQYTSPINQLYKKSSETVKLLILRNKSRLIKELEESGELVLLLGKSTHKELSKDEKNKVKEQLLDICKTVPSLTIFLIPGGSLLLPLLVKYIPSLLPSAFQQNKIEKKE